MRLNLSKKKVKRINAEYSSLYLLKHVETLISEFVRGISELGCSCFVLYQASDLLLRFSFLYSHERIQLVGMSVDRDGASSYLSCKQL